MKIISIFITALLFNSAFAQTDTTKVDSTSSSRSLFSNTQQFPFLNVIPPSPEASALGKYGEMPVSPSNGTISIPVPIFEIKSGAITVPVTLKSHGSAVRVNDISSTVGTNWSLLAGGVITRTVKGWWDECSSIGILNNTIPEETDYANFQCFLGNVSTDFADGQPDDFFYNFGKYSGKLIFNTKNASNNQNISPIAVTYPHSNLKIDWINQSTFRIIDADGNIFKFDTKETSYITNSSRPTQNCGTTYTSSWYLSQIISANGIDTVSFNYSSIYPSTIESARLWSTTLVKTQGGFISNPQYNYDYAVNSNDVSSVFLSEILYKNGKATFSYSNDRQDQNSVFARRLNQITIFTKNDLGNFEELKHFSLNHSYFTCQDGYSQFDYPIGRPNFHTNSYLLKRLKLESITEKDPSGNSLPPYSFQYNEDHLMPIYGSLAQDYWGNSNGALSNIKLLIKDTDYSLTATPSLIYGANRVPNFDFAVAGTIKKITYPTGGTSEIEYEANTFGGIQGGGIRIKSIKSNDLNGNINIKKYNYVKPYWANTLYSGNMENLVYEWHYTKRIANANCLFAIPTITNYPENVNFSLGSNGGSSIAYEEVEEYNENLSGNRLGKKKYFYKPYLDAISGSFPGYEVSLAWRRGQILEEQHYSFLPDNSEVVIKDTKFGYTSLPVAYKSKGYLSRLSNEEYLGQCLLVNTYCSRYPVGNIYTSIEINQQSFVDLPTQTITANYDQYGQDPVIDTTLSDFNTNYLLLTKISQKRSNSSTIEKITRYPFDFLSDPIYNEMVNRHIYTPIIESEIKEANVTLKKTRTNYKQWYSTTSFAGQNGFFEPFSVESSENNAPLEIEVIMGEKLINPTQNGYDLRARPILFTTRKNVPTAFEWWDVSGKKDFLKKKTLLSLFQNFDYSKGNLISSIDQNGFANYFEFDTFNRLKNIKNRDFNLIKSFVYHFYTNINDKNYIKESNYRVATTTELDGQDAQKAIINIKYLDGFGGPIETIGYKQNSLGNDLVSNLQKQDSYGRTIRNLLPTPTNSTTGGFQTFPDILNLAKSFYADLEPLDSTIYEKSLLARPQIQFGPGVTWKTADKKTQILYESAGSDIRYYEVNNANSVILSGFYPANSLFKKRIIDEQGNTTIEITDKQGRLIQSQVQKDNIGNWLTTYYCYDGLGRRRAVLQPEAYKLNQTISATDQAHANFVFAYEYDSRGRLIRQDIPGAGEVYSVYDKADRLVMQKNALQNESGNWNFWQYDAFDREVMRGETGAIGNTQSYWQYYFNQQTQINEAWDYNTHYYNTVSFPSNTNITYSNVKQYQIYDDYDFAASEHAFKADSAYLPRHTSSKGLLTLTVKRDLALIDQGQFRYYIDTYYYDNKNRPIQIFITHDMGGANNNTKYNLKNIEYNFAGEVVNSREWVQSNALPNLTNRNQNTYNHVGLLTYFYHAINGTPIEIYRFTFDPINRLIQKKVMPNGNYLAGGVQDYIFRNTIPLSPLSEEAKKAICLLPGTYIGDSNIPYSASINPNASGGTNISGLQTIDYSHHIRGMLKGINLDVSENETPNTTQGDLFAYKLEYETAGFYDGNIGSQKWQDGQNQRNYSYTYDPSKRLKTATFTGVGSENYSLPNITYDDNGNILNLQRNGKNGTNSFGLIDNLSYSYLGNRLTLVTDAIGTNNEVDFVPRGNNAYTYYSNGNLKSDANEQIANIVYNTYLNQPNEIFLTDGRKIKHYYDGGGALFKTEYLDASGSIFETYHYIDGIIYKNGAFYQIGIPEGRVIYNNGSWQYEFDYKDHLGNIRTSFKAENGSLIKTAKTDFDPWGVILKSSVSNSFKNYLEYQDKLSEKVFGLNRINLGARNYNPTLGRMDKVDFLSGHPNQVMYSPYSANWNNPVIYTDPDGNCPSCPQGDEAAKVYATGATVSNKDGSWEWTGSEWKELSSFKQRENTMSENWSQGNLLQQVGYGFADGIYSMFADKHLNGYGFDSYDDKMTTKVGGLLTFLGPIIGEANVGANVLKVSTSDGFLAGSIKIKTPINIPVQRFGNMNLNRPDFWGLKVGTSSFANRTFAAIKPEWNSLTQYTSGVIPKGTSIDFGIIGPQGWKYPGGSLQFVLPSKNVVNQTSKIIQR